MRRVFYQPETLLDDAGVAAGLKGSLCPKDADVRLDPETGIVAITTAGPWRPDKLGHESGLGVPGWALVGTEYVDDKNAPPEVDKLTLAKLAHADAVPVDVSK